MRNLTEGSIPRSILSMAAPAAVGMFFNTMYNVTDTYWAGQLSPQALAAMSLTFPVYMVLMAFGAGIGAATNALIANALGAKRTRKAEHYLTQAIALVLLLAVVAIALLLPLLLVVFRLNQVSAVTRSYAMRYAGVLIVGAPAMLLPPTLNASLTARGDTRSYGLTLMAGFFANLLLDPLLLWGLHLGGRQWLPALGLPGVALATVLIQLGAAGFLFYRNRRVGALKRSPLLWWRPRRGYICQLSQQGIPAALNVSLIALGSFVINYFATKSGGDTAIAAYGVALRLEQIALIPAMSLNLVLASMVGQNFGARQYQRVRQTYRTALWFGFSTLLLFYLPVVVLSKWLLSLFLAVPSAEITHLGQTYLRIQTISYCAYVQIFLGQSFLQGVKKPKIIFHLGLYRQCVLAIPVFFLFTYWGGTTGLWWGIVVVNTSAALFLHGYLKRKTRLLFPHS